MGGRARDRTWDRAGNGARGSARLLFVLDFVGAIVVQGSRGLAGPRPLALELTQFAGTRLGEGRRSPLDRAAIRDVRRPERLAGGVEARSGRQGEMFSGEHPRRGTLPGCPARPSCPGRAATPGSTAAGATPAGATPARTAVFRGTVADLASAACRTPPAAARPRSIPGTNTAAIGLTEVRWRPIRAGTAPARLGSPARPGSDESGKPVAAETVAAAESLPWRRLWP